MNSRRIDKDSAADSRAALERIPLLLAAVLLAGATMFTYAVRLTEHGSIFPWESSIAMDAMRLLARQPVYDPSHATHLYGPGLTILLAAIFRFTGLNLLAARIVFSLFALVLVATVTWIFCRGKNRRFAVLAACLFLGINLRTLFVFTSSQPDCVAACAAVVALYLWVTRDRSWLRFSCSLALFLIAMLMKQTAAGFALIPIAHLIIWRPPNWPRRFLSSCTPTAFLLAMLALIRFVWPAIFAGMVSTPAALRIYYGRSLPFALFLLSTFPLLVVGLIALFAQPRVPARVRWVCSSLLVLAPVSVWTVSKSGGSYNSFLFAYLAMTALVVAQLDFIFEWIEGLLRHQRLLANGLFALAILCSFFVQIDKALPVLFARCGDDKYGRAIEAARAFGSDVISPEDPTIAYRANGYFGRSLYFELDAHPVNGDWPTTLPAGLQTELDHARCVIEVENYMPATVFARAVTAAGFRPVAFPGLADSAYSMWIRE